MINLIKTIVKDCATGPGGEVFDPARVIGYGTAVSGVGAFLFNSVLAVVQSHTFDPQAYGIGFGAVCAGIMAIGIGVGAKSHTEPPA